MKIHFIAIGGSVMHNMAIAMHLKGYNVTGSDDEIFEPALSRLSKHNLLPLKEGWFPEKIHKNLDAVILGMHAKEDNAELLRARELGVKIYSFPEYIYEQSREKIRVVIGGSHGKTSITSMIMHVLKYYQKDFDYMVGAQLNGFDNMFRISDAPLIVLEGDEYLTSSLDRRPKFHLYKPHIALLSGIAWDHINVFPTFEMYLEQFKKFIDLIEPEGSLIYCTEDTQLNEICTQARKDIRIYPYKTPEYHIEKGITSIVHDNQSYALQIFGRHNLMNLQGAMLVCNQLGINSIEFLKAITSFEGAAKRLELVCSNPGFAFYRDFAHSPSKLQATVQAAKEQNPERQLIACMELHTYSSLNAAFLAQYKSTMDAADTAIIFYSSHALKIKQLPDLNEDIIKLSFGRNDLNVFSDKNKLTEYLIKQSWKNKNLLMMSSGSFDGINYPELSEKLSSS